MAKDDDNTFKIGGVTVEVMDTGDGFGEAIGKALKERFAGRYGIDQMKRDAERCLHNHLDSVDDAATEALTERISGVLKDTQVGDGLMALAQSAAGIIADRHAADEVRAAVAASGLPPEGKAKALETGLHESECWKCYSRHVSVRLAAFGLLMAKIATAITSSEPDAPEDAKAMMRDVVDKVEGRDPQAKPH